MSRTAATLIATFALVAPPATAAAASPAALREGIDAFLQGDFARAGVLLEQAKREVGCRGQAPATRCGQIELYLGLTRASEGATDVARRAFARALGHDPTLRLDPSRDKPSLVKLFEQLRAELAARAAREGEPASRPAAPPSVDREPLVPSGPTEPQPAPRRGRIWTYVAVGAAVAATAAGVGLALSAASDEDDACALLAAEGDCAQRAELLRAADRQHYADLHDSGTTKTTAANVAWVAAGLLAAGALALYWLEGRPAEANARGARRGTRWSLAPFGLALRY